MSVRHKERGGRSEKAVQNTESVLKSCKAPAMLFFSVSFQFYRMRRVLHRSCILTDALDLKLERIALVAEWIEHQTSNLGVADLSRSMCCSGSLVVMTSALHAEGREFTPRPEY